MCLIHCGTVVHNTPRYSISAGKYKWASIGVLQYASRAKYRSWPDHLVWVTSPLTVFMAASTWPLLLGFLGELVLGQTSSLLKTWWRVHWQTWGYCQYGVPLGCHVQIHQRGSSQCQGLAMGILGLMLAGVAVMVPVGGDIGMLGMIQQDVWCLSWFLASIHSA